MRSFVEYLPTVNASLNAAATMLLLAGLAFIKRRRELAHKRAMLSAFAVSMLFLVCYLAYHALKTWHTKFAGPDPIRTLYHLMLASHIVLAASVPVLASTTIYLGLADRRAAHRRWANWTFPIWLYVSVTGVLIYLMLYHLYPAVRTDDTISTMAAAVAPEESS